MVALKQQKQRYVSDKSISFSHIGFASVVILVLVAVGANVLDGILPCNFEGGSRHVTVAVIGVILTLQEGVGIGIELLFCYQITGTAVFIAINHIVRMIGEGKQITGAIIHVGILLRSVILHPGGSAEDVVGVANDKSVSVSHRQQPTGLILVGVGGKATQEMSNFKSRNSFLRYLLLNQFLSNICN